jgi:IgGFc binding protein
MNRPRQLLPIGSSLLGATAIVLIIAACSTRDGFVEPNLTFDRDAAAPAEACGVHCSRDLKQVLNGCPGKEEIVVQCNPDQGCGNSGTCVDACTASELTKGSAGCDFWTVQPPTPTEGRGACFAAMVANTWDRPVAITADFGSAPLDISTATYTVSRIGSDPVYTQLTGPLPVGQVAVVFLGHDKTVFDPERATRCPEEPALTFDAALHATGLGKAFHIKTDAPVSAYSMYPYGGADSAIVSATLLLPVSSWTQNYIAVSPFDFGTVFQPRKRSLQIVAKEDNTDVTIKPTTDIAARGGIAGAAEGVAQTWTLSKGQVLQFVQASLSGSPIETTHPVAVFGGAECSFLPTPYCDTLQQQIPPSAEWGTEYAVVPFRPRMDSVSPDAREQVPYSIVGAADGTNLTYEPSRPLDAPETLASGETANFITDQIFVVKSQDSEHPFHVNVYMTSSTYGGGVYGPPQPGDGFDFYSARPKLSGDPDFVNVPPADQYLDRYVFFTDFTYPETTLTLVRRKTATGFVPVELECAGPIDGWQPLGSSGEYEFAWVTLTSGFLPQKFAKGECSYGRQEAHSTGPFAVTVWGTGFDVSYGYVGGTGLRPINNAVPPTVH